MVDLEHSYEVRQTRGGGLSRLEFLAEYVFDFTTYEPAMSELFARKALEVCAAINRGLNFDYIKDDEGRMWFLLMVNMPFFAGRLDWGTSIRGAWWDHEQPKLESCGFWSGHEQVLSVDFRHDQWMAFIDSLIAFGGAA